MRGDQYRQTLENAGTALVQESARREQAIGTVRRKRHQLEVLAGVGGAAFLSGILFSPLMARLLPFGLDERVAALVLHRNRWDAGASLMASENPGDYRALCKAADLFHANQAAFEPCHEVAAKTKKDQRCTMTVSAAE